MDHHSLSISSGIFNILLSCIVVLLTRLIVAQTILVPASQDSALLLKLDNDGSVFLGILSKIRVY